MPYYYLYAQMPYYYLYTNALLLLVWPPYVVIFIIQKQPMNTCMEIRPGPVSGVGAEAELREKRTILKLTC